MCCNYDFVCHLGIALHSNDCSETTIFCTNSAPEIVIGCVNVTQPITISGV